MRWLSLAVLGTCLLSGCQSEEVAGRGSSHGEFIHVAEPKPSDRVVWDKGRVWDIQNEQYREARNLADPSARWMDAGMNDPRPLGQGSGR